jgi:hypothetical protein
VKRIERLLTATVSDHICAAIVVVSAIYLAAILIDAWLRGAFARFQ